METSKCPPGFIRRRGYTRKNTGTHVKSTCIRTTSKYSSPAKNTSRRQKNRLGSLLGTKKVCPPGEVARKAYVRRITERVRKEGYTRTTKTGKSIKVFPKAKPVFVKAACIKDLGKPGKLPEGAPRIGPLRKGELKRFGYLYKLPDVQRQAALKSAINELGALDIYRKLDAVAKLSTSSAPAASVIFAKDRDWVRKTYGPLRAF